MKAPNFWAIIGVNKRELECEVKRPQNNGIEVHVYEVNMTLKKLPNYQAFPKASVTNFNWNTWNYSLNTCFVYQLLSNTYIQCHWLQFLLCYLSNHLSVWLQVYSLPSYFPFHSEKDLGWGFPLSRLVLHPRIEQMASVNTHLVVDYKSLYVSLPMDSKTWLSFLLGNILFLTEITENLLLINKSQKSEHKFWIQRAQWLLKELIRLFVLLFIGAWLPAAVSFCCTVKSESATHTHISPLF